MILNFVKMSCFCIYHALSAVSSNVSYLQSYQAGETLWAFSCALSGAATLQALWGCNLIPALIELGGLAGQVLLCPLQLESVQTQQKPEAVSCQQAAGWCETKTPFEFLNPTGSVHRENTVETLAWWSWSLSWSGNKAHPQHLLIVNSDHLKSTVIIWITVMITCNVIIIKINNRQIFVCQHPEKGEKSCTWNV